MIRALRIAALWLAAAAPLSAQSGDGLAAEDREPGDPVLPIRFHNLTNTDGLSQVSALAITQDRLGFLWIGTEDGLNRYDGHGFRVLRHRPGDPERSQLGGAIQALHADRSGSLWIGMRTGGFSRFDPSRERFTHYLQGADDLDGLSQYDVSCIYEDRSGSLWIGFRGGGLLRVDPRSDELTHFRHDEADPGSLGHDVVESIAETRGSLWIGTDGGGLDRLDLPADPAAGGDFTHYRHAAGDPAGPARNRVKALHAAAETVWVGTDGGGLLRFDPRAGRFTAVAAGTDPRDRYVWALHGDASGILWLGTRRGGLLRLDPARPRLDAYRHRPDTPGTLSSNDVRSIFEDRSGNLWVGTWTQGVNRFHPDDEPFVNYRHVASDPRSLSDGIVMALHEDRSGALWVGTTGGLNRLDPSRRGAPGSFTRYPADAGDPHGLQDDLVLALAEDASGNLWVGTPGIAHRLDSGRRRFTAYPFDPEASGNPAGTASMAFHADPSGSLWIGTYRGLSRLDPATGTLVHHRHDPADPSSLSHDTVTSLTAGGSEALWIGTLGGLNRLDPSAARFERYFSDPEDPRSLSNDQILHVFPDRAGNLWIGTFGGGLNRFDATSQGSACPPPAGCFRSYDEADGLPNNVVWKILEDDAGRLWMSTTRGLARFDPETEAFTTYDPADGILDYEFNLGSGCRGADGWMYFGGVRGVDAFRPGRFRTNPRPPPVVLTSFRIFQEEADLGVAAPYLEAVELSHRESFFSFEFAALNFRRPDKNRYAFQLEGLDRDWVDSANRAFASYTKVPPGAYVFRVRGSNNDGVWNHEGSRLGIVIHPPLWATWWAYSLYLLATLAVAGAYLRAQRRKRARGRRRHAEREQLIAELEAKNAELERFSYTVSHDLKAPLVTIKNFLGLLRRDAENGDHERLDHDIRRINAAADRMGTLLEELLELSRIGRVVYPAQEVRLGELAREAVETFAEQMSQRGVEVTIADDLPRVFGDRVRLLEVIQNLVENALKYLGEQQQPRIEIGNRHGRTESVFYVRDNGIGIDSRYHEKVFGLFERLDAGTEGTGIGLALVKRIVELHGGRVWVESAGEGQGSSFCFTLPAADGESPPAPDVSTTSRARGR